MGMGFNVKLSTCPPVLDCNPGNEHMTNPSVGREEVAVNVAVYVVHP